jgi:hypothetical protein
MDEQYMWKGSISVGGVVIDEAEGELSLVLSSLTVKLGYKVEKIRSVLGSESIVPLK